MPELPVFSTFYQINEGVEYNFSLIINDSYVIDDINLYPEQPVSKEIIDTKIHKNLDYYLSS